MKQRIHKRTKEKLTICSCVMTLIYNGGVNMQRILWVDKCKSIGMFLIVLGHFLPPRNYLRIVIYSFHVPLFFALSGYVFNPGTNFKSFLKKICKRLIFPYFFYTVLSLPYYFVYEKNVLASELVRKIFFIDGLSIWNGPLWFLVVLFFINIIGYYIASREYNFQIILSIAISIAFLMIGWFLFTNIPSYKYWFGMEKVIFMTPFFLFGYLLRQYDVVDKLQYTVGKTVALLVLTSVLAVFFDDHYPKDISIASFRLNHYWGLTTTSFLGILLIIGIGKVSRHSLKIRNVSKFNLLVMCTHFIFAIQIKRFFPANMVFGILFAVVIFMGYYFIYLRYERHNPDSRNQ